MGKPSNLTNELLGYPADARLLIVNADDFGMCHSVNEAVMRAFPAGILRSTTVMVPCPWGLHALRFLAAHPEIPFGVHLTVISDWADYRWGPLCPREKVPSLIREDGSFYNFDQMPHFLAHVDLKELEMEFRAQIEAVLVGIEGLEPHYQLIVDREGTLDTLEVQVELSEKQFAGADEIKALQKLENQLRKDMKDYLGITARIKLVEPKTIQRSEGKSSRVVDKRKL